MCINFKRFHNFVTFVAQSKKLPVKATQVVGLMPPTTLPPGCGYVLIDLLDSNSNANVWRALHVKTQKEVAIKVFGMDDMRVSSFSSQIREVSFLERMDNPFIVSIYDKFQEKESFFIVMEYICRGNLRDYVNECGCLNETIARNLFCQLICAVEYLHTDPKIIHRDLKAENILIDQNYNIRVIDFGLSIKDSETTKSSTTVSAYYAPELLLGGSYDGKVDIWSLGVVLYGMVTGHLPFDNEDPVVTRSEILNAEPDVPSNLSEQLRDLIFYMLQKDPTKRCSIEQIKSHPWFDSYEYTHLCSFVKSMHRPKKLDSKLDQCIVDSLKQYDIDTTNLRSNLFLNERSEALVSYRILRREIIVEKMSNISSCESDSSEQPSDGQRIKVIERSNCSSSMSCVIFV